MRPPPLFVILTKKKKKKRLPQEEEAMKKKLLLCLFLAITGIIHAADTRIIEFTDSSGRIISKDAIDKNLIDQSNVLKGLSADPSGNLVYQVNDPGITSTHVSRLIGFLKFAADNDFSNQENIIKATEKFKTMLPKKMFKRIDMYSEEIRIADEFNVPSLKLVLNRLEEIEGLAEANPHIS